MTFQKKCPRCETVNFSLEPITACSHCKAPLDTVDASGLPALPSLETCADCRMPISRQAESCPHCGRFYRALRPLGPERSRAWWVATILLALAIFAGMLYAAAVVAALLSGER